MRTQAAGTALAFVEDLVGVELPVSARHVHVIVDRFGIGTVDGIMRLILLRFAIGLAADDMRGSDDLLRAAFGLALLSRANIREINSAGILFYVILYSSAGFYLGTNIPALPAS
jgi:hypothetical protein